MTDLKSKFMTATGDVVAQGDQYRLFAVQVAKNAATDNCKLVFNSGGASGTERLTFQLGEAEDLAPFMFVIPGGNSIRFDDGIYVTFDNASDPLSCTVLYQ